MAEHAAPGPVTVIVLAAQRSGVVNPLASRAGVSHKCLVPICGRPLIAHVLDVLAAAPGVTGIRISLEPEAHGLLLPLLDEWRARGVQLELVASKTNLVDSVIAAAGEVEGPFIITTADNVLLTREGFGQVHAALSHADAAIGLTTRERVRLVHPMAQRHFYEFRAGAFAGCNIFALADRRAFKAAEIFREGGQFMNHPGRMVRAFGLLNIIAMRLKLITLAAAARRIGRRFGLTIAPVLFGDGALAVDVDNERTYAIAEWVLAGRLGQDVPRPDISLSG